MANTLNIKTSFDPLQSTAPNPWVHRLAVGTVCVALLPLFVGALVTTHGAGMAFTDWPGSDGYNIFAYPFWQKTGDKFLEHSHRLAGIVIGVASIAFATVAWLKESRWWVRWMALGLLGGVIAQGILGGQRVLLNERGLAFVHSGFAAILFGFMGILAVVTSDRWRLAAQSVTNRPVSGLLKFAVVTLIAVYLQYVLGGMVRHQGAHLYEHLGWAFVAAACLLGLSLASLSSGAEWLRAPAAIVAFLTLAQLILGAASWILKFGLGIDKYSYGNSVLVRGTPEQVWTCTAHALGGMLLFLTTVVLLTRIARLHWCWKRLQPIVASDSVRMRGSLPAPGGAG